MVPGVHVGAGVIRHPAAVGSGCDHDGGYFEAVPSRIGNVLSYFTVQSNIMVALTTGLLAVQLNRKQTWFRVLRLSGLIRITITGIVLHLALKGLTELNGPAVTADWILHTAASILCVLGWVIFGPRGWITSRIVKLSVLFPVL